MRPAVVVLTEGRKPVCGREQDATRRRGFNRGQEARLRPGAGCDPPSWAAGRDARRRGAEHTGRLSRPYGGGGRMPHPFGFGGLLRACTWLCIVGLLACALCAVVGCLVCVS